jgi:hypothetical protein
MLVVAYLLYSPQVVDVILVKKSNSMNIILLSFMRLYVAAIRNADSQLRLKFENSLLKVYRREAQMHLHLKRL